MTLLSILLLFYYLQSFVTITDSQKRLTLIALADLNPTTPIGAQWLAIKQINNNSKILPDYTLHLKVFDTQTNVPMTLRESLDIVNLTTSQNSPDHIIMPIVLGPPWSSLTIAAAPILNAYKMGLISEGATSITLSNPDEYMYFYRYVAIDFILFYSFVPVVFSSSGALALLHV